MWDVDVASLVKSVLEWEQIWWVSCTTGTVRMDWSKSNVQTCIGHILRLLEKVTEGKMEDKKTTWRPRTVLLNHLMEKNCNHRKQATEWNGTLHRWLASLVYWTCPRAEHLKKRTFRILLAWGAQPNVPAKDAPAYTWNVNIQFRKNTECMNMLQFIKKTKQNKKKPT